jgi:exodeoxyribonuclease VII large subunit
LDELSDKRVLQSPRYYVDDKRLLIDHSQDRLISALQRKVYANREKYARLAAALDAMSPLKVLGRGRATDVAPGDRVMVRLKEDEILCVVE